MYLVANLSTTITNSTRIFCYRNKRRYRTNALYLRVRIVRARCISRDTHGSSHVFKIVALKECYFRKRITWLFIRDVYWVIECLCALPTHVGRYFLKLWITYVKLMNILRKFYSILHEVWIKMPTYKTGKIKNGPNAVFMII